MVVRSSKYSIPGCIVVVVIIICSWYNISSPKKRHLDIYPVTQRFQKSRHRDVVPRIVHVVWFYPERTPLRFHQYISLLSVHKFIQPENIFVWCSHAPEGPWWKSFLARDPPVIQKHMDPPQMVFNRPVKIPEHQSDVARIEVLLQHGGVYLDLDVIILKSFNSLLKYDVTMGAESPNLLGSGLILSKPNSTFLNVWREAYRNFTDDDWNWFSVRKPMEIAKSHPDFIHIEWFGFHRPNWSERKWIFEMGSLWDWSDNYAMHLWYRTHDLEYNPEVIRKLNTTLGEVFRHVYYGSSDIL